MKVADSFASMREISKMILACNEDTRADSIFYSWASEIKQKSAVVIKEIGDEGHLLKLGLVDSDLAQNSLMFFHAEKSTPVKPKLCKLSFAKQYALKDKLPLFPLLKSVGSKCC